MSTATLPDVLPDVDADLSDQNKSPDLFHYVRKAKITESAVLGTHVVALCGEVFPVTKTPKPGSAVCQECKRLYQQMPAGGDE